jgi:hypothetical protein
MAQDPAFFDAYREAWLEVAIPRSGTRDFFPRGPEDHSEAVSLEDQEAFQIGLAFIKTHGEDLIRLYPEVTTIALSLKFVQGKIIPNTPCITFFVARKLPRQQLRDKVIPSFIEGVPTDIIEGGTPRLQHSAAPHAAGSRLRPAQPGTSASHMRVSSGTFGCLVEDETKRYVLSCAHVLSDATGMAGDAVLQPGTHFGGTVPSDQIASLTRTIPLRSGPCVADAGLAEVADPNNTMADIRGIGKPTGSRALKGVGLLVQKSGDATGVTGGVVVGIQGTVGPLQINGAANIYFNDVVITTGMSDPGDSGALLMDYQRQAIGVLFGGLQYGSTYVVSWFSPIEAILQNLGVSLVT